MRVTRSPLLPISRSETQLALLTELFCGAGGELMVSELAERLDMNLSTVAREVQRLEQAGIVEVTKRGRSRFVAANRSLAWADALTELLDRTTGPAAAIGDAFAEVDGVQSVWIFGSWAARRTGVPGPPPRDIDVLIVGSPSELAVSRAALRAERTIHLPVRPLVVSQEVWAEPEAGSFIDEIAHGPLVEVAVRQGG